MFQYVQLQNSWLNNYTAEKCKELPPPMYLQHMNPCCHVMVAHMSQKERQRYKTGHHCHFLGPNQQDALVWYV